ncbi:DUF1992 domain-containing protein [Nocardioides sp. InS609-2]|uniref:DnaJ family domain-containing protein n=1 Tax=Nocardioides sp. InS609-2 TaxID=2760705 RepID=UPI0020BD779B|nr:DUF1992 domain-containing protein [Nocardioides sp. InS609-2]
MSEERKPTAPDRSPERDERTGRSAAAARIHNQSRWVDLQVQQAMERGEFDDLPGRGKPIDLGSGHDPDWWVKKLIEREQITGVLPPALAIRKDDLELDGRLDKVPTEREVRREVEEFNERVRKAIYTPPTGPTAPPVITKRRDVEAEVEAWRERRTARVEAQRAALAEKQPEPRRRWWQGKP